MNEGIKKKKRNHYNTVVVARLKEKYGVTIQFIHQCLRGDRKSETAETIVKEYKRLAKKVDEALKNK